MPIRSSQSPSTSLLHTIDENMTQNHKNAFKFGKSAKLTIQLILTFGYFLAEIIVGYQNSAMSLVADSFHMLSDVLAIFVGIMAVRLKKSKDYNSKYSFGYKRAEVAGALCNSVFLLALCFVIFVEAFQRFIEPEHMKDAKLVFVVGSIGLGVNVVGLVMFWEEGGHGHSHGSGGHGHSHENKSFAENSEIKSIESSEASNSKSSKYNMNIHGVYLHVLGDALGSVVVMIAAGLIWYIETNIIQTNNIINIDQNFVKNYSFSQICSTDQNNSFFFLNQTSCFSPKIADFQEFIENYNDEKLFIKKDFYWFAYNYADPMLSVIITLIILVSTIPLAMESLKIILQARPDNYKDLNLKILEREIGEKVNARIDLHHFHVWELTSDFTIASLHMKLPDDIEIYHKARKSLRDKLCENYQLHHLTIEPEFEDKNSSFVNGGIISDNYTACKSEDCCGEKGCGINS